MTTTTHGLYNYASADYLRMATAAELSASIAAEADDGGAGVIEVEVDGEMIDCYVD